MKSFSENGVVIRVSPEKSRCDLLFLEESFCWPVPPRRPAPLALLLPLLSLAHCTLLQGFLLSVLGGVLSAIHSSAWRPDTPSPVLGSPLWPPWSHLQERRPAWCAEGSGGVFWGGAA